jgi:aminoglycoside phosphotransferase (APT) family kinase protein
MEPTTAELLLKTVAGHLGVEPGTINFQRCNTGKYNNTFFIEGAPKSLVLRVAPQDDRRENLFYEYRMMRQEPGVHKLLRERTSVPVPEIVAHDFSHEQAPRDYLIMQRMPGLPVSESAGLSPGDFNRTLGEVGQALRAAHAIHNEHYGYAGEHRPMEPQANWTDAFVIMWNRLLDDIERCGGYKKEEADSMRRLLDSHLGAFTRNGPSSLLHMDVWAQNILTDNRGRLTALLDWDRACWGDPEIEFAVLDYCGISEPAFWEGYGSQRETDGEAEIRRVFYLLYELQKYIFIRRVRGNNPALADQYRNQSFQIASALGLKL